MDLGHRAIYMPEPMTYPGAALVVVTQPLRVATGVATMGPLVALSSHDSGPAARDAFRQAFAEAYRDIQVGEPLQLEKP
jgi:hypothetical protein